MATKDEPLWSPGAQPVAISGKSSGAKTRRNRRKPFPLGCDRSQAEGAVTAKVGALGALRALVAPRPRGASRLLCACEGVADGRALCFVRGLTHPLTDFAV